MTDLVEKVAYAVHAAIVDVIMFDKGTPTLSMKAEAAAKAAIPIVLEEAAKWHDEQAKAAGATARQWANKMQLKAKAGDMMEAVGYERQFANVSVCHHTSAAAIRALGEPMK